jgi:hypothetical protein
MNPYALPRASSRRLRRPSLAVRSHFHQPRPRLALSHWERTARRDRWARRLDAVILVAGLVSLAAFTVKAFALMGYGS